MTEFERCNYSNCNVEIIWTRIQGRVCTPVSFYQLFFFLSLNFRGKKISLIALWPNYYMRLVLVYEGRTEDLSLFIVNNAWQCNRHKKSLCYGFNIVSFWIVAVLCIFKMAFSTIGNNLEQQVANLWKDPKLWHVYWCCYSRVMQAVAGKLK